MICYTHRVFRLVEFSVWRSISSTLFGGEDMSELISFV